MCIQHMLWQVAPGTTLNAGGLKVYGQIPRIFCKVWVFEELPSILHAMEVEQEGGEEGRRTQQGVPGDGRGWNIPEDG